MVISVKHMVFRKLDLSERAGNSTKAMNDGSAECYDAGTGKVYPLHEIQTLRLRQLEAIEKLDAKIEKARTPTKCLYRVRNLLLLLGFVLIFLAKLLQPYANAV